MKLPRRQFLNLAGMAAARRLVLDGIAISVAGTEEEAIHILAAPLSAAAAQATAIGNGFRLNTVSAAALNGAAMHVLDFEPMWSLAEPCAVDHARRRAGAGRG